MSIYYKRKIIIVIKRITRNLFTIRAIRNIIKLKFEIKLIKKL